jgi:hypothetical protein
VFAVPVRVATSFGIHKFIYTQNAMSKLLTGTTSQYAELSEVSPCTNGLLSSSKSAIFFGEKIFEKGKPLLQ